MKPREPVFIRHSQTHATVAVSEARGALSLITHPYAACVSASDHRDSVGTQTLMQLKRSKHEVQPLISLLFFTQKEDSGVHSRNQQWLSPLRRLIMKHCTYQHTHTHT